MFYFLMTLFSFTEKGVREQAVGFIDNAETFEGIPH